ncbi:MAG TPA: YdjY domain-containing protein [Chthoniobacteraceae bacterium]|jgi:hypothetical protein|nr:YdjY domain-containing protein [Chthoniobacteraceae bacterium]
MRIPAPLLALFPLVLAAQEPAPKPSVKEVSPGVFEVGAIRFEQKTKTVTFPGSINMDKGGLEYLLVGKNGPTHESLLVTEITPTELETVMILLGAKPPKPAMVGVDSPPGQLTKEYLQHAPKLAGEQISITAAWKDKAGAEKSTEVADWLYYLPNKKSASRGPWLYSGSMFGADNKFLAQIEDIFASLVTNPAALMNNPRKGSDDDRVWEVNEKAVPPAGTPVTITIQLQPAAGK